MTERWALIVADFRREYAADTDALAGMSLPEFMWLLQGLSDKARFRTAWHDEPKHMHDPEDRARITAAARR